MSLPRHNERTLVACTRGVPHGKSSDVHQSGSDGGSLSQISSVPTRDDDGQTLDTYQRAKDVLLVVLPLLTTALGYWFGAAGRESAEAKASAALSEAKRTQQKLEGVLGSSREQDLLSKAQALYPDAFGLARQASHARTGSAP
jgi:hypothetical protein